MILIWLLQPISPWRSTLVCPLMFIAHSLRYVFMLFLLLISYLLNCLVQYFTFFLLAYDGTCWVHIPCFVVICTRALYDDNENLWIVNLAACSYNKSKLPKSTYCGATYYLCSPGQDSRLWPVLHCSGCVFSQRIPHRADVSYDSTASVWTGITLSMCVKRGSFFLLFFLALILWILSRGKIDTHDEEGLLLFGETWNRGPRFLARSRSTGSRIFADAWAGDGAEEVEPVTQK